VDQDLLVKWDPRVTEATEVSQEIKDLWVLQEHLVCEEKQVLR
jgi:hypothetical protein